MARPRTTAGCEALRVALVRRWPRICARRRDELLRSSEAASVAVWTRAGLSRADAVMIATDPAMHRWRGA